MKETKATSPHLLSGKKDARNVLVLLRSSYFMLSGSWKWDLLTDSIFCSDVILSIAPEISGPRALIHPDDVPHLSEVLANENEKPVDLEFRIITTYGEIRSIYGTDIQVVEDAVPMDSPENLLNNKIDQEKELQELRLLKEVYITAEKLTDSGTWFYNTVTHECWYSDQVFRIHGQPPQSLNSHLHTFLSFIKTEEKEQTKEFIDKAYSKRLPLHLDFRIETSRGERKVRYISDWTFNEKGEEILNGVYQDVTAQKDLEEKLSTFEQLSVFHKQIAAQDELHAGLAHWQLNLLTRKITFSDNFYRLFNLKPQQITGIISLANYIHPDDNENFLISVNKLLNEHLPPDIDYRILRPDGSMRYIQQRARLITPDSEKVMAVTMQDITVRKVLDKKLAELTDQLALKEYIRQQEEQLTGSGSWLMNITTGATTWSEGIYQLLGLRPHSVEMTQKRLVLVVHAEDKKKFSEELSRVIKEKQDKEFGFKAVVRGETRYMKASFRIVRSKDSEYFHGQIIDQTKEAKLEKELFEQAQVAESLAENIVHRIIITDINHNIILWNKQSEIEYGIKQEAAIGKNFFDVFPYMKTEEQLSVYARVLQGEAIHLTDQRSFSQKNYFNIHMLPLWSQHSTEVTGIIHIIQDITKEYELRKNLGERLSFTESLIDSSVDRIIVLDKNMNYVAWNKRCEEAYGLTKKDVIGKNVLEVFPGWQNEAGYGYFRKALKGETVHLVPSDDENRDYEIYLIPVKNPANEITAVLWVMHDFELQFQLERQKKKNLAVLNSLDENYLELDRSYRFVFLNKSAERFFGFTSEEAVGNIIWDMVPASLNTKLQDAVLHAMEAGEPVRNEFMSPSRKVPVFVSITPTEEGVSILFIDMTREKETEIKLKEREDLIAQVTYATPDAITIYDLENRQPLYLNNCLADWLGYSNEELTRMGAEGRLKLFIPEDRLRMQEFNKKMNAADDAALLTIEYTLISKDGSAVKIRNRSKVFRRNDEGKAVKMLSVLQRLQG